MGGGEGGVTSHLASDRSWRGRLKALRGFVVCFFPLFFHEQRWLLLTQILESQYMYILVVISGAFINFLLHNHSVNIK